MFRRRLGPQAEANLAEAFVALGETDLARGQPQEARAPLTEAVALREKYGSQSWDLGEARERLGEALAGTGDAGARALLQQAATTLEAQLGADHPHSHWIVIRYEGVASASTPRPYRVVQYFGYDVKARRFVDVLVDNSGSGSSYGAGHSSGWRGDLMSFDNTTGSNHSLFRDVLKRNGTGELSHTGYMRNEHGKWVETDQETCHKS